MILVVGATGALGSEICRRLRERNLPVRGLVRPGSPKEAALRALGVEICSGDLRSPSDVERACRGVSAVISTATAMGSKDKSLRLRAIDRDGQLQLVEAAKKGGVKQFIYLSLSPHLQSTAPLVRYKREVEAAVRASGMRWTILQPSVFMEIWLSHLLGWDFDRAQATVFGAGTAPIAYISLADVAEHAVRSLDDPRLANRDLPLGGPGTSPNDVVKIFEAVSGRRYRTKRIPRAVMLIAGPVLGQFSEMIGSALGMSAQAALGDVVPTPLQAELGLPLTTLREYATKVLT